ncbi:MAG: hypothetical protein V1882_02050 [Candidatus Omnitrophota bacterium]
MRFFDDWEITREMNLWERFNKLKNKTEKILKEASDHDTAQWALAKLQEAEKKELMAFLNDEQASGHRNSFLQIR